MIMRTAATWIIRISVLLLCLTGTRMVPASGGFTTSSTHVLAQGAATQQTATQFYLAYREIFDKAKSVDDIKPHHSKAVRDQMDATPAAERAEMFELVKMMGAMTNVKVVKETVTAQGATLSVEATDPGGAKATGEVTLVKEDGDWKLEKESWKS